MKKLTLFFVMAACCHYCTLAQSADTTVYLSLADTSQLLGIDSNSVPHFSDAGVNSTLSAYRFRAFKQLFPTSRFQYMRAIYGVVCDNSNIGAVLKAASPTTRLMPQETTCAITTMTRNGARRLPARWWPVRLG